MKNTNRLITFIVAVLMPLYIYAAVANYNHFPTLKPSHILDEKLTNISFAFGMRLLVSDYNGPLVRLRRTSDNAEKDFGWGDDDRVDISAINTWRNGSNVHVHTWYDQSGLGRNAVQTETIVNRQPRFYPDATIPYFQGDGSNDHLTVNTPNGIQDVTNSGAEGTVITLVRTTNERSYSFGVLTIDANNVTANRRWFSIMNWVDRTFIFDPGSCCGGTRTFNNNANANTWLVYSYIRQTANSIVRVGSTEMLNGAYTGNCTTTVDFTIGWAGGNTTLPRHATTRFSEFIMYATDITVTQVQEIEQNSMTFWGL